MGHAIFSSQTKQKSVHFSDSSQKYADKVFQIVSSKMCHVTQRRPLKMHDTLALECYCFFPKTKKTP